MRQTLTKGERICSFKEIESLFSKGSSFFHYPFKVNYILSAAVQNGYGAGIIVSVPKRNFKRAVKRNLIKRRIRESYRLNKGTLVLSQDKKISIMFVYVSKHIMGYAEIETGLKQALEKINSALAL